MHFMLMSKHTDLLAVQVYIVSSHIKTDLQSHKKKKFSYLLVDKTEH